MVAKKSAAGKAAAKKTAAGTSSTAVGGEGGEGGEEEQSAAGTTAAKKTAGKKSAAKKSAAKKTAAKKTAAGSDGEAAPAKKAAAKKSTAKSTAKKSTAKKAPAAKKAAGSEAGAAGTSAPAKKRAAAKTATTTGATTVVAKKTAETGLDGDGPQSAETGAGAVPKARGTLTDPASLPVRPGEDPWTADELAEARAELTAEASRLRSEIETSEESLVGLLRDSQDGAGEDEADTGSKNITREHELGIAAHAREVLEQTERALERIEAGTYGVCENCGNAIGKARMQAFPRATLCVECKQKQERRY